MFYRHTHTHTSSSRLSLRFITGIHWLNLDKDFLGRTWLKSKSPPPPPPEVSRSRKYFASFLALSAEGDTIPLSCAPCENGVLCKDLNAEYLGNSFLVSSVSYNKNLNTAFATCHDNRDGTWSREPHAPGDHVADWSRREEQSPGGRCIFLHELKCVPRVLGFCRSEGWAAEATIVRDKGEGQGRSEGICNVLTSGQGCVWAVRQKKPGGVFH